MNVPPPDSPQAIWVPPAPSTGRGGVRWRRALAIGVVVAIHVVVIAMFAARPLGLRLPGMAPDENVVYLASELTPPEPASTARGQAVNPADLMESEATRRARGDFVPPRLVRESVGDVTPYARRAGIPAGGSTQVILAVEISEQGVPGNVRVSSSSGSTQADTLAIEYARTLRWNPAQDRGRQSRASIRLPVILAVAD